MKGVGFRVKGEEVLGLEVKGVGCWVKGEEVKGEE